MTTLIVVRHGQSVSNLNQCFTGQNETPLTDLGRAQAEATARYLDRFCIHRIYSSDLSRAMDTAKPTAKRQGVDIEMRPALREIYAGEWEMQPYTVLREKYRASYERWLKDLGRAHPEGGESTQELAARVFTEVDRILGENRGKTVAIFTHATPTRMLACRWFGIPTLEAARVPFCTNASVSVVEYEDDGSFRLVQYGYDQHQGDHVTRFPKGLV